MSAEAWIAFGALLFAILAGSIGAVWALSSKMSTNRSAFLQQFQDLNVSFDAEVTAIRQSTFIEFRDIRREFNEALQKAYLEFGEAPKSIREKLNQVELFMRDEYLPKKDYDRDHNRLLDTIRLLGESIGRRLDKFEAKLDDQRSFHAEPNTVR